MLFKLAFVSLATTAALASVPLDPVCPKGFHSGVQINDFQFDRPFSEFYQLTKSFFNITWYGGFPVNQTIGTDNTPGAIREVPFGNGTFKEQLVTYNSDKTTSLFQKYVSLVQDVFTIPANPDKQFIVHSYTEQFAFDSICGGTATALHMMIVFCANDPVAVAAGWNLERQVTTQALSQEMHANTFVGNCPSLY